MLMTAVLPVALCCAGLTGAQLFYRPWGRLPRPEGVTQSITNHNQGHNLPSLSNAITWITYPITVNHQKTDPITSDNQQLPIQSLSITTNPDQPRSTFIETKPWSLTEKLSCLLVIIAVLLTYKQTTKWRSMRTCYWSRPAAGWHGSYSFRSCLLKGMKLEMKDLRVLHLQILHPVHLY